jgi:predicted kinase
MKTLYMTVGVPGSGKSYWIENQARPDPNLVKVISTQRTNDLEQMRNTWRSAWHELMDWILYDERQIAIFDACFVSREARRPILNRCAMYRVRPVAVCFDVPPELAFDRNLGRPDDTRVPNATWVHSARNFEIPSTGPHDNSEPFDEVWIYTLEFDRGICGECRYSRIGKYGDPYGADEAHPDPAARLEARFRQQDPAPK